MTDHSVDYVQSLFSYEEDTGFLRWKSRPLHHFADIGSFKSWNTRYAGKEAFTALNGNGYRRGGIDGKLYYAHRVAWVLFFGQWPAVQIDHKNGNRADNRIENLVACTNQENAKNAKMKKNNTSGHTGVVWFKRDGTWKAQLHVNGKNKHIGYFERLDDAVGAREKWSKDNGYTERHGKNEWA